MLSSILKELFLQVNKKSKKFFDMLFRMYAFLSSIICINIHFKHFLYNSIFFIFILEQTLYFFHFFCIFFTRFFDVFHIKKQRIFY